MQELVEIDVDLAAITQAATEKAERNSLPSENLSQIIKGPHLDFSLYSPLLEAIGGAIRQGTMIIDFSLIQEVE